jgi:Ala-tRNA(Pro) deacylase
MSLPANTQPVRQKGEYNMSIPRKITEFLDSRRIWYQHCTHSPAYTAQGLAHVQHVSGKELAKVVMVVADSKLVMTVLPGSHRVDLDLLAPLLQCQTLRLATEEEFRNSFPDCELGAMPPFGNLYGVETHVDTALEGHPTITFNAGTHVETIQMSFEDFRKLAEPRMGSFSVHRH